jgi:hypothetical protein
MARTTIQKIRIHPAIGVARLGNSPNGYFIGPEVPGVYPDVRGYRDDTHFLNRQAARFRLFAYDEKDEVIGEISREDPRVESIHWTVHLRNTKGAGHRFEGILHPNSRLRNKGVPRKSLVLDGGVAHIEGIDHEAVDMCCPRFMNKKFPKCLKLGTLLTDDAGRLLVLGGHGQSGTLTGAKLEKRGDDFANHDGWYDDTSDGSVRATIRWKSAQQIPAAAETSWVLVAPPKYAPSLESVITLYDILYQLALKDRRLNKWKKSAWLKGVLEPRPKPSFRRDIYPILRRAYEMRWVFARAEVGHENEINLTRLSQRHLEELCKSAKHIFRQFRVPSDDPSKPGSGTGKMPYLWSDLYLMDDDQDVPHPVNATLTPHQHAVMKNWACGNFDQDWHQASRPSKQITPEGLDRAALDACIGAAFFPGIETSFHIRDKFHYIEPFRLDPAQVQPGDVTQQMSLPWQTDFVDCSDGDSPLVWWPAQRPIDVRLDLSKPPVRWARDFRGNKTDVSAREMVDDWWRLGLLQPLAKGLVETQRVNLPRRKPRSKELEHGL